MDNEKILSLVKDNLGFRTNVRDTYVMSIIAAVIKELEDEKGLVLDDANPNHLLFIADYSAWRYRNVSKNESMPRDIQFRLHNLIIHDGR